MKMRCLRLQNVTATEHGLHKQDFSSDMIPAYISDGRMMSHYRAFQRFCPSSLYNGKVEAKAEAKNT